MISEIEKMTFALCAIAIGATEFAKAQTFAEPKTGQSLGGVSSSRELSLGDLANQLEFH